MPNPEGGGSRSDLGLELEGSRFVMRPALAIQFGGEWREKSETRSGVAREAITTDFGDDWLARDDVLGEVEAIDGIRGRGAAGWVPVLEWIGFQVAGLGVAEGVRAAIRHLRERIQEAKAKGHRVLVSRGLAAALAMEHVFETTTETEVLNVEFVQEPSVLGGRPPTETSYTGLEPWIVSLVNGSRRMRYVLVVSAAGEVQGMVQAEAGEFDPDYGLLPPVDP